MVSVFKPSSKGHSAGRGTALPLWNSNAPFTPSPLSRSPSRSLSSPSDNSGNVSPADRAPQLLPVQDDDDGDGDDAEFQFGHPLTRMIRVESLSSDSNSGSSSGSPRDDAGEDDRNLLNESRETADRLARLSLSGLAESLSSRSSSDSDSDSDYASEDSEDLKNVGYESWYRQDFESVLNDLCARDPSPFNVSDNYVAVGATSSTTKDSLMVKRFNLPPTSSHPTAHLYNTHLYHHHHHRNHDQQYHRHHIYRHFQQSSELTILLQLNHKDLREDPWNPVPHIVRAIERDEPITNCPSCTSRRTGEGTEQPMENNVYLFLEGLREYDNPPLKTVQNYIDLFRQTLEGLTFLHEHHLAFRDCSNPRAVMVDIGLSSGSTSSRGVTPSPSNPLMDKKWILQVQNPDGGYPPPLPRIPSSTPALQFDRAVHPVKYYYSNFSKAIKVNVEKDGGSLYKQDVIDCGELFDSLLINIPKVAPKLKSLVKSMTSGEFGADDARKLFEAMCKSLESSVFDIPALQLKILMSKSFSPASP